MSLNQNAFAQLYDAQADSCIHVFSASLSHSAGSQVVDFVNDARSEALTNFDTLQGNRQRHVHNNPSDSLIVPAGGEDPEQESMEGLQRCLSALADDQ